MQWHLAASQVANVDRQTGHVLVLGLLMLSAASVMFVRHHAVGQMASHRIGQTHALDAATYSAALVQARSLNTLGYMNRAQIGHQLAMAHLVTLGSWATFGGAQASRQAIGNPPSHLITMMFGADHGAAYRAAARAAGFEAMSRTQGDLSRTYAEHDATVRNVLVRVQHDIVRSVPSDREHVLRQVLHDHYPEQAPHGFQLQIQHDNWHGFLEQTPGHGTLRQMVKSVVSLYHFLDPRNHTVSNQWVVDGRCPALRHQLRRRGETRLNEAGVWQSIDTQSFHALRSNRWLGCYYREYAMGWGWIPSASTQPMSEPHTETPPEDFSAQDFWRWVSESTNWDIKSGQDNPLANSMAHSTKPQWKGGGLPAVFDVAAQANPKGLFFAATLKLMGPDGIPVTTRSAARTFYVRPDARQDGLFEAHNLYRPYWQANLAVHPDQGFSALQKRTP